MAPVIRVAEASDIQDIVEMQAVVWQDHFLKERNMQVPMMRRSAKNMKYYMAKDPGGTFVMVDKDRIVGSIVSHVWGSVGWFGPLEINPVCQGKGYGKSMVASAVKYLRARGCTTIGCETMAGSPKNIGFYSKLGFKPKALSHVLYKRLGEMGPGAGQGDARPLDMGKDLAACKGLWNAIQGGLDYTPELSNALNRELGEAWAMDTGNGLGHAIVHTYEMFDDSQNAIVKLLVAGDNDLDVAAALLDRCELSAVLAGKTGMFLRTYDGSPPALRWFLSRGYVLQGNSVRLILEGPDEAPGNVHISCWSG